MLNRYKTIGCRKNQKKSKSNPLLSKKSVTASEISQFKEARQSYLAELENQRIAKQYELYGLSDEEVALVEG